MAEVGKEAERHQTSNGLEDYLRIARDRAWIIALAVIVVVRGALFVSFRTTPMYAASASLVYQRNDLGNELTGYGLYSYDYDKDRSIATAVAAVRSSEAMAAAVKTQLGSASSRTPGELMGMVSVGTSSGSDLVYVDAVSTDPKEAADVANAYADQFVIYRQNADRAQVAAARDVVETQIKTLSPTDLQTDYGLMLQEKRETLRILEAMQDGGFTLLRQAGTLGTQYTPQTQRNIVLALVVGLVLGVGLAFLLEYLDKRIKDEKTLEQMTGLPVLAAVPAVGGKWRTARKGHRRSEVVGFEGAGSGCWSRSGRSVPAFSISTSTATCTPSHHQRSSPGGQDRDDGKPGYQPGALRQARDHSRGRPPAPHGARVPGLETRSAYRGTRREVLHRPRLQLVQMEPFVPARARGPEAGRGLARKEPLLPALRTAAAQPRRAAGFRPDGASHRRIQAMADYVLVDSAPYCWFRTLSLSPVTSMRSW